MLIERPPQIFRNLYPSALYRIETRRKEVFLTFDDGPIPEATPWILDCLDRYDAKATFFMVGDNARRYPHLLRDVRERGHAIGNHTMHHLQAARVNTRDYLADVAEADAYLHTPLFRAPHGWLRRPQATALRRHFRLVMYDLVTRDYSRYIDAAGITERVRRYTRPGSIIVFHDSLKSIAKLHTALPESLEWLRSEGYVFSLPDSRFFADTRFYPYAAHQLPGLSQAEMIPVALNAKQR